MPELGFQDLRSGLRARDLSPDSVIFTAKSNFSLFSSASASVERCSFASNVPDQDSVASSVVSHHLTGNELSKVLSDPDPDPNKLIPVHKNSISHSRKEKAKVQKFDSSEAETTEDKNVAIKSARNSFSRALKDCQDRRLRSEVLLKKAERRRPASLDLNNPVPNAVSSSSPRFDVMKKPAQRSGAFPSPGTPNYRVGVQKGWSSERIPHHTSSNRRSVAAILPYNNGRTLPSKWEDAERWIFSPVSGDGTLRNLNQQAQRRPKSKSGPIGPPGVASYQMFSPAVPMFEGGHNGKVMASSPFSSRVMAGDGLSVRYGGGENTGNFLIGTEPCMAKSISIHGCSEMISQSSFTGHHDAKYDGIDDSANNISRAVSRRDMAIQMSPESSNQSSPRRASSFSLATSISKIQREEAKITAWENLQKAKAEAAIRKMEMKLEKKRSSSMDKIMNKLRRAQKKAQDMRSSMVTNHHITRPSWRALSFRRARPISSLSGCFTCRAF